MRVASMDEGFAKRCFMLHVGLVLYTQNCFALPIKTSETGPVVLSTPGPQF